MGSAQNCRVCCWSGRRKWLLPSAANTCRLFAPFTFCLLLVAHPPPPPSAPLFPPPKADTSKRDPLESHNQRQASYFPSKSCSDDPNSRRMIERERERESAHFHTQRSLIKHCVVLPLTCVMLAQPTRATHHLTFALSPVRCIDFGLAVVVAVVWLSCHFGGSCRCWHANSVARPLAGCCGCCFYFVRLTTTTTSVVAVADCEPPTLTSSPGRAAGSLNE